MSKDWKFHKRNILSTVQDSFRFNASGVKDPSDENGTSIYQLQEEGVAALWKILKEHKISILADEVGMGKTYQAIAICCLQWLVKPDARILIFTPNRTIANNWINEYYQFMSNHYRETDDIIKSSLTGEPVNQPYLFKKHDDLLDVVKQKWCHLFVGSIYFLSTLSSEENKDNKGRKLRKDIIDSNGSLDLIIIDEAHYFRHVDGGSNRARTAEALFQEEGVPLSEKYLLLTATPNYSHDDDVKNIVNLFQPDYIRTHDHDGDITNEEILKQIAIRRLKRLLGESKYSYRKEEPQRVDFNDNPEAELFFALYQKKLAESRYHSTRGMLTGYLEGFESLNTEMKSENLSSEESRTARAEKDDQDYDKAPDHQILSHLVTFYKNAFHREILDHPKMDTLVYSLFDIPEGKVYPEKHLIFVRRIASVKEISARINYKMDEVFWRKIQKAWKQKGIRLRNFTKDISRKSYQEMLGKDDEIEEEVDDADTGEVFVDQDDLNTSSRIFSLFTIRKNPNDNDVASTHASNFRKLFFQESSPFSLFFEPAIDYGNGAYPGFHREQQKGSTDPKYVYRSSAVYQRIDGQWSQKTGSTSQAEKERVQSYLVSRKVFIDFKTPVLPKNYSLYSLLYDLLTEDEWSAYDQLDFYEKECFGAFFKKGILFASPLLIDLYSLYITLPNRSYASFIEAVSKQTELVGNFKDFFLRAVKQFPVFSRKIMGLTNRDSLLKESWNMFNKISPALFCSGAVTQRERIINSFNSVFYPDYVVSTSVLQEGVNMHSNCKRIVHYGLPANAGAAEQRTGRVDRHSCMVEQERKDYNSSFIHVQYPYLAKTYDQDQLKDFLFKYKEARRLIDKCQKEDFQTENKHDLAMDIDLESILQNNLSQQNDPFPAYHYKNRKDLFLKPQRSEISVRERVVKLFQQVASISLLEEENQGNLLGIIDSRILYDDPSGAETIRHQPVFVEIHYSSVLSGLQEGTIYYLTLKTPLSREVVWKDELKDYDGSEEVNFDDLYKCYLDVQEQHKMVQFCLDPQLRDSNYFKYYLKVDLPLILINGDNTNLQIQEIESAYMELLITSDHIEDMAFKQQDLKLKQIKEYELFSAGKLVKSVVKDDWVRDYDYFSPERKTLDNEILDYNRQLILTHEYPFVSVLQKRDQAFLELHYPEKWCGDGEPELLQAWYDFVYAMLK